MENVIMGIKIAKPSGWDFHTGVTYHYPSLIGHTITNLNARFYPLQCDPGIHFSLTAADALNAMHPAWTPRFFELAVSLDDIVYPKHFNEVNELLNEEKLRASSVYVVRELQLNDPLVFGPNFTPPGRRKKEQPIGKRKASKDQEYNDQLVKDQVRILAEIFSPIYYYQPVQFINEKPALVNHQDFRDFRLVEKEVLDFYEYARKAFKTLCLAHQGSLTPTTNEGSIRFSTSDSLLTNYDFLYTLSVLWEKACLPEKENPARPFLTLLHNGLALVGIHQGKLLIQEIN